MDLELQTLAQELAGYMLEQGLVLATAESCTGGWISKCVTDIPGSSAWLDRGFVTYTNAAKQDMLAVAGATLEQYGAVSEATVTEMALGALANSLANVAVAVSGIAGPGGGTPDKPVGTVYFAWAIDGHDPVTRRELFPGNREEVRRQTVRLALSELIRLLDTRG